MSLLNDFLIRHATLIDAQALADIHVRSWQEAYAGIMPDQFLNTMDPSTRVDGWRRTLQQSSDGKTRLVAELDESGTQGFAVTGPSRSSEFPECGEIEAIYLRKRFHGQGIGRALFDASLRALLGQGYRKAFLWVLETNPTRTFYEAAGGILTPFKKEIELAGVALSEVAYSWDLTKWSQPIYHLTSEREWQRQKSSGFFSANSLATEGFIHFSERHQLHRVANFLYRDLSDPIVLAVDTAKLKSALKFESEPEQFPHLYGPLNVDAVVSEIKPIRTQEGRYLAL